MELYEFLQVTCGVLAWVKMWTVVRLPATEATEASKASVGVKGMNPAVGHPKTVSYVSYRYSVVFCASLSTIFVGIFGILLSPCEAPQCLMQ